MVNNQLRLVAWEVTRTCTLNCRHCRGGSENHAYADELSTAEFEIVMQKLAMHYKPVIILTGGEPLMRADIFHIARYGTDLGFKMVMATCGQLLDLETCTKLKNCGIQRISLSLDGKNRETHDALRRVDGAFDTVIRAIEQANSAGLEFQINTTVTKLNLDELPEILDLAIRLGAKSFHPFLLVPTGRGTSLKDLEISGEDYEKTLNWFYDSRNNAGITIKPTCAPHYYRILRQREASLGRSVNRESHGLEAMTKGCLGGQGFAFISHKGSVQICGFLDIEAGHLKKTDYDFNNIWENSSLFTAIRKLDEYKGKCGYCEYRKVCGGCRARSYYSTNDFLDEEPLCIYEPVKQKKG